MSFSQRDCRYSITHHVIMQLKAPAKDHEPNKNVVFKQDKDSDVLF